jgi:hypothetical protein
VGELRFAGAAPGAVGELRFAGAAPGAVGELRFAGAAPGAAGELLFVSDLSDHRTPQRQQVSVWRAIGASHLRHSRGKCRSRIRQRSRAGELPDSIWGVMCIW